MKIYILGSLAFDEIGQYHGHFDALFRTEHLKNLSVSFVVEDTARFFGGCAGNVAYSLGLLDVPANLCGLLGDDGHFYKEALEDCKMDTTNVFLMPGHTAHVMIATDLDGKQIAQFAPGVIGKNAPYFKLPKEAEAGDILFVAPENHDRMIQAVEQGSKMGLRVFFDPGQMIHTFSKKEVLGLLNLSEGVFANDYEWGLLKEVSGLSDKQIFSKLKLVFITHGADGVSFYVDEKENFVESVSAVQVDPTGAGDAFRAGVLAGFYKGLAIKSAVQIGTILGASSVEYPKTQGHHLTEDQLLVIKNLGF
ncbi:MAG: PfkB family carbohydrate kinase [Candidatus Gracilibacteria bacterium]